MSRATPLPQPISRALAGRIPDAFIARRRTAWRHCIQKCSGVATSNHSSAMLTVVDSDRVSILLTRSIGRAEVESVIDQIGWTAFHFEEDLTDVFAHDSKIEKDQTVGEEQEYDQGRETGRNHVGIGKERDGGVD